MSGRREPADRGMFRPGHAKLWVGVAILAVSTAAILIRYSGSHPVTISFWRLAIAEAVIAPFALYMILVRGERIRAKELMGLIVVGLALALHFALWIWSLSFTTVASSVLIVTMHPLFVAGVSYWMFREELNRKAVFGMVGALIGAIVLMGGDHFISGRALLGDLMALGGAVMVGAYILSGSRYRRSMSLPMYAFVVYGSASIFLLLFAVGLGVEVIVKDPVEYLYFSLLAVVPMLMGHTVYNWSLKYVSPTLVSVSLLGEPVFSSIWAVILLSEYPGFGVYIGAPLVLAGIFLVAVNTRTGLKQ